MEASAVPRVAPTGVATFASPGLLRLLSDDRLVALIRDGNRNAFEALYDRHHRAILSFCRHMLGSTDEAEDAVQHTFLAAYNDLVSSRKPIRLRAWLFTIARNRCLSILRARRDRAALEFEEQATDGLAAEVQRRQDLRDLVVDINHLPEDQRAALVLAEIGALTHDEIGSVIGVPRGKVKALVFQARESLLASRAARETDCFEIREQLATMRGGALRRTTLRRHLRECQGCRDYRHEVESQRRRIAVILPVIPTIALREGVLGVTAGGAVAGAGAAGGGLLGTGSLLKGIVGKAVVAAMLAAVGTTGILVVHDIRLNPGSAPYRHLGSMTSKSLAAMAPRFEGSSKPLRLAGTAGTGSLSTGLGAGAWRGAETATTLAHPVTRQLSAGTLPSGAGGTGSSTQSPAGVSPVVTATAPVSSASTGALSARPVPGSLSPGRSSSGGGSGPSGLSSKGSGGEGLGRRLAQALGRRFGHGSGRGAGLGRGTGSVPGDTGSSSSSGSGSTSTSTGGSSGDPGTIEPGGPSIDSGKGNGSSGAGSGTGDTGTTGTGTTGTGTTGTGTTGSGSTGTTGTGTGTGTGSGSGTTGSGSTGPGDPGTSGSGTGPGSNAVTGSGSAGGGTDSSDDIETAQGGATGQDAQYVTDLATGL